MFKFDNFFSEIHFRVSILCTIFKDGSTDENKKKPQWTWVFKVRVSQNMEDFFFTFFLYFSEAYHSWLVRHVLD